MSTKRTAIFEEDENDKDFHQSKTQMFKKKTFSIMSMNKVTQNMS